MKPDDRTAIMIPATVSRSKLLLAIALIVLGQLNLLTHLFETDSAHPGHCLVCAQLHTQGHGLAAPAFAVQPAVPEIFPLIPRLADVATAALRIPGARAPPRLYFS